MEDPKHRRLLFDHEYYFLIIINFYWNTGELAIDILLGFYSLPGFKIPFGEPKIFVARAGMDHG
ncbi:hypothetical protein [Cyclobacterium sp. SYSU L10401]|uniref:hypothetical protein n=1 Tax=Cyclobacterium sp. SYSU L10401 TaxID=2678657 RepID=UPI0013D4DF83|nr:hypothetical protein [Cyclobacterium sp. SYSU L10401]